MHPPSDETKVFILDDNIISLMIAEELLVERGFAVVKMSTPNGFLAKLGYERPEVLIFDPTMPRLDLEAVISAIKESPKLEDTALILYSDLEPQEIYELARQYGLDGYFCKSLEITKLPEFIDQLYESQPRTNDHDDHSDE